MASIKDKVKPTENTRGGASGAASSSSSAPRTTMLDVIDKVKNSVEARLWRIDKMQIDDSTEIHVLVGRAPTRDGSRTFPAVVLRLYRNGNAVRDYTFSASSLWFLYQWLSQANDKKIGYFVDFISAFKQVARVVNAETEDFEEGEGE